MQNTVPHLSGSSDPEIKAIYDEVFGLYNNKNISVHDIIKKLAECQVLITYIIYLLSILT